jgi:hypothetical protein
MTICLGCGGRQDLLQPFYVKFKLIVSKTMRSLHLNSNYILLFSILISKTKFNIPCYTENMIEEWQWNWPNKINC